MGEAPRVESGRIWGGYAVQSVIAEGANATVYRVTHTRRKTTHALKVLKGVDSRKQLRIEQEAIFREELRHQNIVPATDAIEVDGRPALVMELVEGPSLADWLVDGAPDDLLERLRVFRGIVDGCAYAHARGVIHRDLKPTNIQLQRGPDGWVPRISDFGLARALAPELGRFGGLTTVNTGLGTAGYAAPEQVRDATSVDARADLYSLGCILYELVCGIAPFSGMSTFDTLQAQKEGRYRAPEELAPGLPPAVYALIRELVEPDRDRRLATAEALIARVDALLAQGEVAPTRAPSAPPSPATVDGLDLGPALVLSAIPIGAMLLGAAVVFWSR